MTCNGKTPLSASNVLLSLALVGIFGYFLQYLMRHVVIPGHPMSNRTRKSPTPSIFMNIDRYTGRYKTPFLLTIRSIIIDQRYLPLYKYKCVFFIFNVQDLTKTKPTLRHEKYTIYTKKIHYTKNCSWPARRSRRCDTASRSSASSCLVCPVTRHPSEQWRFPAENDSLRHSGLPSGYRPVSQAESADSAPVRHTAP